MKTRRPNSLQLAEEPESRPLDLVVSLARALEEGNFNYCHWKSNEGLSASLRQGVDLDLLVGRGDARRFTELLLRLGFKEARVTKEREVPGVHDYYGLDATSGELVHVHAHFQLAVGDDTTKNYRVPIEEAYLASSVRGPVFRVPSPEFEYVLFVIRMVLKHAPWDALLTHAGGLSNTEKRELAYLTARVDRQQVGAILADQLPHLGEELFDSSVRLLEQGGSPWFRVKVARRLHRALAAEARRNQRVDTPLKLWRRGVDRAQRQVWGHPRRKQLATGGALIAVVGGDGSGKSSAVNALHEWLARNFVVTEVHLGKPPHSVARIVAKGALAAGRRMGGSGRATRNAAMSTAPPEGILRYAWLIRQVTTARDRYRAYVRARRRASTGQIVVCDRYPLPEIKLMDAPALVRLAPSRHDALVRYLSDLERSYYKRIGNPDILVVLKLDPEIALQRKPEEDAGLVLTRGTEVWNHDWQGTQALIVDAARPEREVMAEIKSFVWRRL